MSQVTYTLEDRPEERTGIKMPTLVKVVTESTKKSDEELCTVMDIENLFDAAAQRWPDGFDLAKVTRAVTEANFD